MITKPQKENHVRFPLVPFSMREKSSSSAPQIGLIVLQSDLTIENEMRYFFNNSIFSMLSTRITCDDQVTTQNLEKMASQFSKSLNLFPPNHEFDVIAYGCTSGALMIGDQAIFNMISSQVKVRHVTNPLIAAKKALSFFNARKIGFLAPYISEISETMCAELENNQFRVMSAATFGESLDSVAGRINPDSIYDAIHLIARNTGTKKLDAIFVSCKSLNCASIIMKIEKELKIPILSSNSVLAWDIAELSNISLKNLRLSSLFKL